VQLAPGIAELFELVHGEAGNFSMLKAYFDESGIHTGAPVCVVAGFVATTRCCNDLAWNWHGLLKKYDLEFFHAREYAKHSGPFREGPPHLYRTAREIFAHHPPNWDTDCRRQFETDAIAVIYGSLDRSDPLILVGAAINTRDFLALSVDHRRWLTGGYMSRAKRWKRQGAPTKPYFLAFQQAVLDAVKFSQHYDSSGRHLGTGDIVHFVFDQQFEYERSARAIFNAMKRSPLSVKDRIGDVVFSSKARALPLQVADFIAYESFCFLVERINRNRDLMRRHAARRLFRMSAMRSVYIGAKELKKLLHVCPPLPDSLFRLPDPVDDRVARGVAGRGLRPGVTYGWNDGYE
jgi:hypothetical protein